MTADADLEGTLKLLSIPRHDLLEVVADEYVALAREYGPRNVLVLKRHPAGLEYVRERLARTDADGTPASPLLESVPEHASKVLEEYDPTIERLEYEERIELISLVIAGATREIPPYLERAREHESFARDVGQLLLEATRQRIRYADFDSEDDSLHECLAFLYAMNDRFHDVLADRGLIERADVVPRVVSLLETDDDLRTRITSSFDAVLALEFEEFRSLDREYLALLTREAETALVCLGERHASIERTRVEPGSIDHVADSIPGLAIEPCDRACEPTGPHSTPPHRAITHVLATGTMPESESHDDLEAEIAPGAERGRARRIRAETFREQVRQVAAEIQYLLERHDGWTHDDVAVAVPTVDRVPDARDGLRNAGVPTATIGTAALNEDPAVSELYAVVSYNCGHDVDLATERLAARVSGFDSNSDADSDSDSDSDSGFSPELVERCSDGSVSRSLERWIHRTELKRRIVEDESWVDGAAQFESVRRVLDIARFVEETDLVGPDWEGVRRMLRRTITYDAPHVHDVETRSPTGGVTVCAVTDLKYDSREVVFLLDLTDGAYPGDRWSHLTQLFPTAWLRAMPHFPAVTDPSPETLERTFGPVDADRLRGDPFEAYHAQRSRRALALGTRAARSHLYCCSYQRESGGLRRTHDQSRYLTLLENRPGFVLEDVDALARTTTIRGEANALEALLDEPWRELERILREASTGGEASLAETEELFQEIQVVLAHLEGGGDNGDGILDDNADLAEAVRSQFEFAAGEVLRDE